MHQQAIAVDVDIILPKLLCCPPCLFTFRWFPVLVRGTPGEKFTSWNISPISWCLDKVIHFITWKRNYRCTYIPEKYFNRGYWRKLIDKLHKITALNRNVHCKADVNFFWLDRLKWDKVNIGCFSKRIVWICNGICCNYEVVHLYCLVYSGMRFIVVRDFCSISWIRIQNST